MDRHTEAMHILTHWPAMVIKLYKRDCCRQCTFLFHRLLCFCLYLLFCFYWRRWKFHMSILIYKDKQIILCAYPHIITREVLKKSDHIEWWCAIRLFWSKGSYFVFSHQGYGNTTSHAAHTPANAGSKPTVAFFPTLLPASKNRPFLHHNGVHSHPQHLSNGAVLASVPPVTLKGNSTPCGCHGSRILGFVVRFLFRPRTLKYRNGQGFDRSLDTRPKGCSQKYFWSYIQKVAINRTLF